MICPGRVETDFFAHESFRRRAPRRETARTVPIEVVSRAIIDAIERDRFMTNVPRYYGALAWFAAAVPPLFRPLWHRLLASRVESVYDELAKDRSAVTSPERVPRGAANMRHLRKSSG